MRIALTATRDAAIDMARTLLSERHEVLRLVGKDDGEIISGEQLRILCAKGRNRISGGSNC